MRRSTPEQLRKDGQAIGSMSFHPDDTHHGYEDETDLSPWHLGFVEGWEKARDEYFAVTQPRLPDGFETL